MKYILLTIFIPMVLFTVSPEHASLTLWQSDIEQQRTVMNHNENLQRAASYKARLIYETGVVSHCINGYCPNKMIHDFGCDNNYEDNANYVESLAIGSTKPGVVYQALKDSKPHYSHIVGNGFYNNQSEVAIGVYEDVFVFISSVCD